MSDQTRAMQGEISEREDLLDGRVRIDLDGRAGGESGDDGDGGGGWVVAASFGWRRGREGAVELDEGELTLIDGDQELFASLDMGTAEPDDETGAARISASFVIDHSAGDWPQPVARIACTVDAGSEQWSGELRLG
jgi:hypothetical protein